MTAVRMRHVCVGAVLTLFCSPAVPFVQQLGLPRYPTAIARRYSKCRKHAEGSHRPNRRGGRLPVIESSAAGATTQAAEGPKARECESAADRSARAAAVQEGRARRLVSATSKPNPKTDRFRMKRFHHVEFFCGDATAAASRFVWGLGMALVAKSDQSTGNTQHASYVVQSNDLRFVCTAPYSLANATPPSRGGERTAAAEASAVSGDAVSGGCCSSPFPGFDAEAAHRFFQRHGLAGRAIGIEVEDARLAFEQCIGNGGVGVQPPTLVSDRDGRGDVTLSEVHAYGDVVLRFISFGEVSSDGEGGRWSEGGKREPGGFSGAFLPNFADVEVDPSRKNFGLQRADHIVGNVWDMLESVEYIAGMTGMHEFAEFAATDVGTVESGLNSIVLASDSEMVLLPLNEPTFGTAKKSQIQTYLEQNEGPGLQHMALKTNDIFRTMRLLRANSGLGGFDFMEPPGPGYYRGVPERIPSLTKDQLRQIEELGLLVDKDEEGVLLQVFTKPIGDRPTLFFEIIQRIGCAFEATGEADEGDKGVIPSSPSRDGVVREMLQRAGCGGFGLGNFKALFESIEKYESTLAVGTEGEL